jgi:hypothetical protein
MKWWFLLQDNERLHNAHVMVDVLTDIGGTPVEHTPSSPDLILCDFYAFLILKHVLCEHKLSTELKWNKPLPLLHARCLDMTYCMCLRSGWGTAKQIQQVKGEISKKKVPKPRESSDSCNVNSLITFQTPLISRDQYQNWTYFRCHFFCTTLYTITMHTDIQSAMYNTTSCFYNCQFLSQHIHVNVNYVHYQTCYCIYRPVKQLSGKQLSQRGTGPTTVMIFKIKHLNISRIFNP